MVLAFAVAGVSQVVLERRAGMDFMTVQKEVEMHFWGLIMAASLFTTGVIAYVWNFIRYGMPTALATGKPSMAQEPAPEPPLPAVAAARS
jgi:nitric oxide reductase subunit B